MLAATTLALSTMTLATHADPGFIDFGARAGFELGTGVPANDMVVVGVFSHYKLKNGLLLGGAIDLADYDFERAAKVMGITQDEVANSTIDAKTSVKNISFWLENRNQINLSPSEWYWRAGLGVGLVDADDLAGPVLGGGTFNITTDGGTEFLALAGLGYRYKFGDKWTLDSYLGITEHFADWKLTDTVSTTTGSVGNYGTASLLIGLDHSF